ncbi:DUF3016 domain-containing protein [Shewanella youngdeokensis]|uniref:DUF3016 domain-containing protein n=1 Tax=Shewanella youngdeokensis TaxID=2999068 RepID=A0ABZ0JWS2_9GAMM|nr:DUF3016 domain-containing protein [Shewanella sp. DAU334]
MNLKHILVTGFVLAGSLLSAATWAADEVVENPVTEDGIVKIEWQEPKNFKDVEAGSDIQSRFEKRTFENITKGLNKEAAKLLKPNQKLEMVVTDLDLAGDVRPSFGATTHDLRVIKDLYPPRMTFSYKVIEDNKTVIVGDEKLLDFNFMHSTHSHSNRPNRYEVEMLKSWLKKTIEPQL